MFIHDICLREESSPLSQIVIPTMFVPGVRYIMIFGGLFLKSIPQIALLKHALLTQKIKMPINDICLREESSPYSRMEDPATPTDIQIKTLEIDEDSVNKSVNEVASKRCINPYKDGHIAVRIGCYAATLTITFLLMYWIVAIPSGFALYNCLSDGSCFNMEPFTFDSLCADTFTVASGVNVQSPSVVGLGVSTSTAEFVDGATGVVMAKMTLAPTANGGEGYTIRPGASRCNIKGTMRIVNETAFGGAISAFLSNRPMAIDIHLEVPVSAFVFPVGNPHLDHLCVCVCVCVSEC